MLDRLLDSEIITLFILFGLGILAAWVLGAESKDIFNLLIGGLLGYLTKGIKSSGVSNPVSSFKDQVSNTGDPT